MTIRGRARAVYNSIGGLVPTLVLAAVAAAVLWYAAGGVAGWYDSRSARNEAARQKQLAEQHKAEAEKWQAEAARLNDGYQREKGRAEELDRRAASLEQERTGLVTALDDAREASVGARQRYDIVRRTPTRRPPAPPDLDRQRRERELCELYPDDERCKR